jgi:peptidoglycan endopeptidase LytE
VLAAIVAVSAVPLVARTIDGGPVEAADVESAPDVRPAWPTDQPTDRPADRSSASGVPDLGANLVDVEPPVEALAAPAPEAATEPVPESPVESPLEAAIAVMTDAYAWDERGPRVEELQLVLGVAIDGWYGQSTLSAHRRALESAGFPTDRLPVAPGPSAEQWAALRECESGGDYAITNPSGKYRGAYQFDRRTWNSVAERHAPRLVGTDPAAASPADQDAMALALYGERGSRPWPNCGRHLR